MGVLSGLPISGLRMLAAGLLALVPFAAGSAKGQTASTPAAQTAAPVKNSSSPANSTPASAAPKPSQTAKLHAHKKKSLPADAGAQAAAAAPVVPAVPPAPDWPVNDKPGTPSVNWDGRDLSIVATNSTLAQILSDVSVATGVKVEGAPGDQRVYGRYGPAPARDVLNQLLEGSGVNILMIGDSGQGTPREVVLTQKTAAASTRTQNQSRPTAEDEVADEPEPVEQQEPIHRRPFGMNPQPPGRAEETPQDQQRTQPQQPPQPPPQPQNPQQPNN
jgi:hypothetical protein